MFPLVTFLINKLPVESLWARLCLRPLWTAERALEELAQEGHGVGREMPAGPVAKSLSLIVVWADPRRASGLSRSYFFRNLPKCYSHMQSKFYNAITRSFRRENFNCPPFVGSIGQSFKQRETPSKEGGGGGRLFYLFGANLPETTFTFHFAFSIPFLIICIILIERGRQ